jgi:hypothetical protein
MLVPIVPGGVVVTYLWIALVVMVALSPLISMRPTRRQRLIADLRQQAAICGVNVQLRALPGSPEGGELLPYYGRLRQRGDRPVTANAVYRREGEAWRASAGDTPEQLRVLFAELPMGVSHVCENLQGVGVFWDERGEEADVRRIDEVLKRILHR